MTNWIKDDPKIIDGHWCFLNAQDTPFYYAMFASKNQALHARNIYLEKIGEYPSYIPMRSDDVIEPHIADLIIDGLR